jgi:hypothetical protein
MSWGQPHSRETAQSWTIDVGNVSALPNGLVIRNMTGNAVELMWWHPAGVEVMQHVEGLAIVPGTVRHGRTVTWHVVGPEPAPDEMPH